MNPWLRTLTQWLAPARRTAPTDPAAAPPDHAPVPAGATASASPAPAPQPAAPRACATVVIPALNEAAHIADVVQHAWSDPATAQVIVVDDSSIDDTAALARAAGAEVITSSLLGKGASMRDGAEAARCPLVVYLDGDLSGLRPQLITDLCRPLTDDRADFVKARFGRGGGRVTELTAKPMLKVFFPELAGFAQPLGGVIAARVALLETLVFEDGYGVDIGLLIDAHRAGARLAEVDIGRLEHDSQPLHDLTAMANEVSRVIYLRARQAGRLHMEQIAAMYETQRQATATLDYILTRRRGRTQVLLLAMDGTVSPVCFTRALASATGREAELDQLLREYPDGDPPPARVAALFRFVHRQQFERVAQALPLRPGVVEGVNRLRRAGVMVGVVSEGWFVAAEILRRRIFADFALAHTLQFDGDVCSGELRLNPAYEPLRPSRGAGAGQHHVVQRVRQDEATPPVSTVWAVGHGLGDLALLREADRAFVIDPPRPSLAHAADATVLGTFDELPLLADRLLQPEASAAA